MIKRIFNKMKKEIVHFRETFRTLLYALAIAYMTMPVRVYAAGGSYTAPLDNLKTIGLTICASAGVIVLIFGVVRFGAAFQKMDQNGEHAAINTMIFGGILLGASGILAALGV